MVMLWGAHVGLRPFEEPLTDEQAARVYRWSNNPELLRWSGGTPTDLTFEEFRERLKSERRNAWNHRRMFFIVTLAGELIGRIGVFAIDWDRLEGELGIIIGEPAEWNKGYGREAVGLLLRYVFEMTTLERVHLYTFLNNLRAQHCFIACGFRNLGVTRRFAPDIGEYEGIEMEITRREFRARHRGRGDPANPESAL